MLPLTVAVSASSPTRPLTPYSGQLCAAPSYVNAWLSAVTVTGRGVILTTAEVCSSYGVPPTVTVPLTYTVYSPTFVNVGISSV